MTLPLIHIVDDDASFRTAIGRLLQTSGYRVVQFESGSKYLEILPPPEEPCCILLDLKMAGMDGLGLQERLAELGSVSPVVFLTGHGDIATSVQALKGGAENFLTKPVPKATLLEAVNAAMARFEQQRGPARQAPESPATGFAVDGARAGGVFPRHPRQAEQADRALAEHVGAHHQGAPPQHHAEAGGAFGGRGGHDCRAARPAGLSRQ